MSSSKEGVELFGIPFRIFDEKQLFQLNSEELEKNQLYSVFCVEAGQCSYLAEAQKELNKLSRILWIPVGTAMSSVFPKKDRHMIAEFSVWKYLKLFGTYAGDTGAELGILMDEEEQCELILQEFRKEFPYLSLHTVQYEDFSSDEAVVNEVNSVAPDILFIGLRMDEMRHFLEEDRHRTNARLCVFVGDLLLDDMTKKKKWFHTITMSRYLKKMLHKYNKKELKSHESEV